MVGFGAAASDDGDDGDDNDPFGSDYEIEGTIGATDDDGDSENEDDQSEADLDDDDTASVASASSVSSTASQKAAKEAFFAPAPTEAKGAKNDSFASLNISRPLIRAFTAMSLSTPTPIQAQTIPLALEGQDILGLATTGSVLETMVSHVHSYSHVSHCLPVLITSPTLNREGFNGAEISPTMNRAFWRLCTSLQAI